MCNPTAKPEQHGDDHRDSVGLPDFRGKEGFWEAYPAVAKLGLSFAEMADPMWFESEPHLPDALTGFPNVVLTPHIGGHTVESHIAMQDCVIANLDAFFAGRALPHQVQGG